LGAALEALGSGDPRSIGEYQLVGFLGRGGMGRVYLGKSPEGMLVAIKVISPEWTQEPTFRERFRVEMQAVARVGGGYVADLVSCAPGRRYADSRRQARATDPAPRRLFDEEDAMAAASGTVGDDERFLAELASCDGLVLLFDPTREWESSDAFNHFHGTLLKIAQRRMRDPNRTTDLLPQYVAVCTTKFDHNDVYRKACELGFRSFSTADRRFFPKISDERAEQFFIAMGRESERSNADLVRDTLRNFFAGDRIQFFVSSAIGFRLDHATGQFDEQEFENFDDRSGPTARIKGPVYPINVIEPLMWLGENLADGR
jgi:hypothetical protein